MNDDMLFLKMAREDALKAELAALREELAMWKGRTTNVCMKLTATEQRNSEFEGFVRKYRRVLLARKFSDNDEGDMWRRATKIEIEALNAVLTKPTESGASE